MTRARRQDAIPDYQPAPRVRAGQPPESTEAGSVRRRLTEVRSPPMLQVMSGQEIDDYLAALDEPARSTLGALRRTILEVLPDAEECISYGMPAFRVHGKVVAGFAAFKHHLSYLPHSGSVLSELRDDVAPYAHTPGALRFAMDIPLPKELVRKLIAVRMAEIDPAD